MAPFFDERSKDEYAVPATNGTNGHNREFTHNGVVDDVKRDPLTGIHVVIAGAGLGGLTAAMECWRKGHTVSIYERNAGPVLTGDTIGIQPGALLFLEHWPKAKAEIEGNQLDCNLMYRKQGGDLIFGPSGPTFNDDENLNFPGRREQHVGFSQLRSKLWHTLLKQVQRIGITIQYDKRIQEFFENEEAGKGGIVFHDGTVALGDVVVAADGLKTKSSAIVGGGVTAMPSGKAIYRCAYDIKHAENVPEVRERFFVKPGEKSQWNFYLGPGNGQHCMAIAFDDKISWAMTHTDTEGSAEESWEPDVLPEEVIKKLETAPGKWDPNLVALMRTAPKGAIVHWKLMWRDLNDTWVSPHGRVAQVGDSAHSFFPSSGNGGTQAMEDAVTLATCLQLAGRERAAVATKAYNALRYQRVSCAQKLSFVNAQTLQQPDWAALEAKPEIIRTKFCKWIYNHNPETYAYQKFGEAMHHVLTGAELINTNIPVGHKFQSWTIDDVLQDLKDGKRLEEMLTGDWS